MKLTYLALLAGLASCQALSSEIYTCVENGVRKFSGFPCGNEERYELTPPVATTPLTTQITKVKRTPEQQKPKENTSVLRIRSENCDSLPTQGGYSAELKNSSKKFAVEAHLSVSFDFEKEDGKKQSGWDEKRAVIKLQPGQRRTVQLKSRTMPPRSKVFCHSQLKGVAID